MYETCDCKCVYGPHACLVPQRAQKRAPDPLEWELQTVVGAGKKPVPMEKQPVLLNPWAISPFPQKSFLKR